MIRKIIFTLAMAVTTVAGMAKDIKTVVFTTQPQMHCENCEAKIKGNLRFEKGVKKIETNIERQEVIVTYDADKTNEERLRTAFEKFGYEATRIEKQEKETGKTEK